MAELSMVLTIVGRLIELFFFIFWLVVIVKLVVRGFSYLYKLLGGVPVEKGCRITKHRAKIYRRCAMTYAIEDLRRVRNDYFDETVILKPKDYRELGAAYLNRKDPDRSQTEIMCELINEKLKLL